jgi:hypothetical protein
MTEQHPGTHIFDLDYFSGSQCFLYVGDVWVDEVTSLSYQVEQSKTPIYGYASQMWDDVAAGHLIVQGQFTINFKEAGYLWAILRRYKQISGLNTGMPFTKDDDRLLAVGEGSTHTMPDLMNKKGDRVGSNGTRFSRATIERICNGEITRQERFDFYHNLVGYATMNSKRPRDKAFEDIVEAFEDQVWNPHGSNLDLINQLRRPDDNRFDGFDMYVVFGNYSMPGANHTVQKIIDVRLLSQGKQIVADGQPIQEYYSFIARTVV